MLVVVTLEAVEQLLKSNKVDFSCPPCLEMLTISVLLVSVTNVRAPYPAVI